MIILPLFIYRGKFHQSNLQVTREAIVVYLLDAIDICGFHWIQPLHCWYKVMDTYSILN